MHSMEHRSGSLFIAGGLLVVVAAVGASAVASCDRHEKHRPAPAARPSGETVTAVVDGNVVQVSGNAGATVTVNGKLITSGECVKPQGPMVSKPRPIGAVHGVMVQGSIDLELTPGEPALTVEASPNLIDLVESRIEEGVLVLSIRGCVSGETRVHLSAPSLTAITLQGSGAVETTAPLRATFLSLALTGSGDATLALEVDRLETTLAGSGDITLHGRAGEHTAALTGSGSIEAADLATRVTEVSLRGSGTVEADASEALRGNLAGSGDVRHKGAAPSTITVTGSGDVSAL
jgi:putative autotransporter adhesin-like protein